MDIKNYKKILILGDSGRGKTTFAKNLSEKFSIPTYDTDDFFWKVKYTIPNNREESVIDINEIYQNSEWIMSGSTRRLIIGGLEGADIVFVLKFRNIFFQYYYIIKRSLFRSEEKLVGLWNLLAHVTKKKYKKGYGSHTPPLEEIVNEYKEKVIVFHSFKEINKYLESIN